MPESNYGERTEPATPRQRDKAREQGRVAKSVEVNFAVVLLAGTLGLYYLAPAMFDQMGALMQFYLGNLLDSTVSPDGFRGSFMSVTVRTLEIMGPLMLVVFLAAVLANVLQFGFLFSWTALMPKGERINPLAGLQRIASWQSLGNLIKSLVKTGIVGYVAYLTIRGDMGMLLAAGESGVGGGLLILGHTMFKLAFRVIIVILILAILDYLFQRWQFEKSLRMTKQQLREELKETEGDPMIRARVRQIQREMARKRMLERVPTAQVVVTNPTHYAVALSYERDHMSAPTIVAKGRGLWAQKIKEIAREHRVPVIEDPPLARALHDSVEVGMEIPEQLYQAVAKVLAYVYNLKARRRAAAMPQPVEVRS